MKLKTTLTALFIAAFASCCAFAAEPLLLDTSRSGNRFYLTEYEQSEGRVSVVLRCVFSEEERSRTVALLSRQGVADAEKLACNDYKLRYSEDGSRYQRLYDVYLDAEGGKVFTLAQNPDAWYSTPAQAEQLPAKALLEASRRLGVPMTLPEAVPDESDAASLQSSSPRRVMSAAALAAAFRADKKLFAANYENAIVRVRGIRGSVSRDYDMVSLQLLSADGKPCILCLFEDDDAASLSAVKRGAEITVEGVYRRGKTPKAVIILDNCELLTAAKK